MNIKKSTSGINMHFLKYSQLQRIVAKKKRKRWNIVWKIFKENEKFSKKNTQNNLYFSHKFKDPPCDILNFLLIFLFLGMVDRILYVYWTFDIKPVLMALFNDAIPFKSVTVLIQESRVNEMYFRTRNVEDWK